MAAAPKVEPPAPRPKGHPPVEVRQQIADGPKFTPQPEKGICAACRGFAEKTEITHIDSHTALGPFCWAAGWRWGFNREAGIAGSP